MNKVQSYHPATISIKAIGNQYLRAQCLHWIFRFKSFQGSHRDKDNPHVPTHRLVWKKARLKMGQPVHCFKTRKRSLYWVQEPNKDRVCTLLPRCPLNRVNMAWHTVEVLKGKDLHFNCHQMLWLMYEVCIHMRGIKKKKKQNKKKE